MTAKAEICLNFNLAANKTSQSSQFRISGKVIEMKEIPVASRNILSGEVISNSDINFEVRPLSSLRKNALTDKDSLIEMKAKRDIKKGSGITLTDISKDYIIQKGQQVSMIIKSGNMSLSAYGIALDNGVKGEIIRLKNIKTNKTVQGKIIEKDSVIVDFGTNFATD
jgi:flagella basal body P-ring formation protein FlgA